MISGLRMRIISVFSNILQEAGTEDGLSAPLQCVVAELHREYDTQLQADLELLSSDVYLPYLLFLYSEARLLR